MDDRTPSRVNEDAYPLTFADDEILTRIVRTPQFVRDGKLRANAFRPQQGKDRVSIVRWPYRPRPESRLKAICHEVGNSGKNTYAGQGVFTAAAVAGTQVLLEDARDEYEGHAHLVFPFRVMANEPLESGLFAQQTALAERLTKAACYVEDPAPQSEEWTIRHELLPLDEAG